MDIRCVDITLVFFQIESHPVQRMADQLPMMICFYMLKETAQLLSTDMLSLLDGANASELLFENSDGSRKRRDLQVRLDHLTAAQEALSDFIWGIYWLVDIIWRYI